MSDVPFVRGQFLEALNRLSDKDENTADLTRSLRKALLDFASKTHDNHMNCLVTEGRLVQCLLIGELRT